MPRFAAMSERMSWLDDPRVARRLARFTWVALVTAFVLLTRFDYGSTATRLAVAGLIMAVGVLNAPVVFGLWKSRAEADTLPFRLVALALGVRVLASGWVVWFLTPR